MAILELKDVTKKFGGLTAVDGVNLKVEENQICALIGPNGAGKTTVFNMITGAYQVTSGDVVFNSESICGKKPHQIVEKGIARTFQNIRLFKSATVLENVMTGFHCKTKTGMFNVIFNYRKCMQEEDECREKALEILRFLGLEDVKNLEARNIPYGRQRLLEIGRALATSPKLLLLDEPAAGMNSQEKKELVNTIRKIRDTYHLAVLLVEHDMELVMGIDRMPKTATVFDCVINPPLSETITAARTAGLNTVPGMRMLVAQMDVIFKFLFNQTVTGADKQACIEELCNYLGVPSNF